MHVIRISLIICAFLLFFPYSSQADSLEFELKSYMLQSARTLKTQRGYEALFRLAEPYSGEFAKLTRENIGRRLTMRYNGRAIISVGIQSEIIGGGFTGGVFSTCQEAEDLIREIMPGIGEIPGPEPFQHEPSQMDLQPGMLQSARILKTARGHEVVFRFAEPYRPLFADLTRGSIGRRIIMRCDGRIIATLDIQGEITDGAFAGDAFPTREEAEALIREVMSRIGEMPVAESVSPAPKPRRGAGAR